MPYWPEAAVGNAPVITSFGTQSLGALLAQSNANLSTLSMITTWPTANKAFIVPFRIRNVPWVARGAFVLNGSAVSGDVDVGIYDRRGNRLVSTGATAQAGTSAAQRISLTPTTLQPGLYWMALSVSNTTGRVARSGAIPTQTGAFVPLWIMTSAHPLPDPITFTAIDTTFLPAFGLTTLTI